MEDIFKPICSIYLIDKTEDNVNSENECSHCKKPIKSENEVAGKLRESLTTSTKNLSKYLYQSSNAAL